MHFCRYSWIRAWFRYVQVFARFLDRFSHSLLVLNLVLFVCPYGNSSMQTSVHNSTAESSSTALNLIAQWEIYSEIYSEI